jgi:glycosyltransferase involved in cell wall biosynthesis
MRISFDKAKQIFCRPTFVERDLPTLIADCAVGIFPVISKIGLAVLEHPAAGLPTIAYDAGPAPDPSGAT